MASATSLRLFVALWPQASVRATLAACRDRIAWPAGARPTPDDKLHLTLQFIGEQPAPALPRLAEVLAAAVPAPLFELALAPLAHWPNGLVVLLAAQPAPPALGALHARLAGALQALGIEVERRRLLPHVTLARNCSQRVELPAPQPLRWPVDGFALVQSAPGGRYRVVRHYDGVAPS